MAAIVAHCCRIFFTGAFRKPRETNWLIGVGLISLGLLEGFAGYSLPDDLLSGTGLRIAYGIVESIPVVGSYLGSFVFGGQFPGPDFIPRLFTIHILLVPGHPARPHHRAPAPHVAPKAHPVAGRAPHQHQCCRRAVLPRVHGQDRRLLLRDLRSDRRVVSPRADQPGVALRAVQPGASRRRLAAGLLHRLARRLAAHDAQPRDACRRPHDQLERADPRSRASRRPVHRDGAVSVPRGLGHPRLQRAQHLRPAAQPAGPHGARRRRPH